MCVYCGQGHPSSSCSTIIDIAIQKEILRKAGRCYTCLKRHHLSKNCRSRLRCDNCRGRHHVTICSRNVGQNTNPSIPRQNASSRVPSQGSEGSTPMTTNSFYASAGTPILLQTAQLQLFNPHSVNVCTVARAILDSGSQRTYITRHLREEMNLSTIRTELLRIKTFGRTECDDTSCDVVRMGIETKNNETLVVTALVVPFICNPLTTQPIDASSENHSHLLGLELADTADASDTLETDMLIGSDCYWSLVTGRIIKGENGPTAIHTKARWVLSGPADQPGVTLTFTTTHTLNIETHSPLEENLDDHLKWFGNSNHLESQMMCHQFTPGLSNKSSMMARGTK